jgi:hypothetical protein
VSSSFNSTTAQEILGTVERLRLRSPGPVLAYRFSSLVQDHSARAGSKRSTVNVIRNQPAIVLAGKPAISLADQQRNPTTLDQTNLASLRVMKYVFSQLARPPQ